MSSWKTSTGSNPELLQGSRRDSNSGESRSTVPSRSGGSLAAFPEVAKAIAGLLRRIWREISESEERGLEGERMAPRESKER